MTVGNKEVRTSLKCTNIGYIHLKRKLKPSNQFALGVTLKSM